MGMGGLGSPICLYLAAAGIGSLGIVDFDSVEINNLHRQVIHKEKHTGMSKVKSAEIAIKELYSFNFRINSKCRVISFETAITSSNAIEIIKDFDMVVDASDNVATRYLLNDVCVLLEKPLISGSALRFEGQITTYNWNGGPCYRCLFPVPPPPETVTNCNDGGVLGPIVGTIGSLQALEVIKCILGTPSIAFSDCRLRWKDAHF